MDERWSAWIKGRSCDVRYTRKPGKTFRCQVEILGRVSQHTSTRTGTGKVVGKKKIIWVTWRGIRMTLETVCQL